jgi:excisionase family DNA binding protein
MARSVRIARKPSTRDQNTVSAPPQWPVDVPSVRDVAERPPAYTAREQGAPDRVRGPPGPLKLLTVREAAEYAKVSIQTVRRWIKAGYIKTYRAGRQIRIDEPDLIRFLSAQ